MRLIHNQECYWKFLINLPIQKDGWAWTKTAPMVRAWWQNKRRNNFWKTMNSTRRGWILDLAKARKPHTWREHRLGPKASYEAQRGELTIQRFWGAAPEGNKPGVRKHHRLQRHSWKLRVSFPLLSGSVAAIWPPNLSHSPGQPGCEALFIYSLGTRGQTLPRLRNR